MEERVARNVYELIQLLQSVLRETAFRGLPPDVREEIEQEVRLSLWRSLADIQQGKIQFELKKPVSERYIRRSVKNQRTDTLTQRGKERAVFQDELDEVAAEEPRPPTPLDVPKALAAVQVLRALKPDYREILRLFYLRGLDHARISQELGISQAASRQRLSRARKQARKIAKTFL